MTGQAGRAGTVMLAALVLLLVAAPRTGAQDAAALFDDTQLTTLELRVHARDWDDLKAGYERNDFYPADVAWHGAEATNVGIRSRGNGSRSGVKPGLEIEADRYVGGERFLGMRSLVLDNLVTDPSMMREMAAMAFLRRVGLPAPREAFVRLVVNGQFVGVYAVVESVDREFAERAVGEPGWLFEFRWSYPYYEEYLGDALEPYRALFASRNPSGRSIAELYTPIRDLFRQLDELRNGDLTPLEGQLDLTQAVQLLAADAYLADIDGLLGQDGLNNLYLHVGRVARLLPWDKDHAFWASDAPVVREHEAHRLMARVWSDNRLRALFLDALDVQTEASEQWLAGAITRYRDLLRPAVAEDTVKPYTTEAFEEAVDELLAFAAYRPRFVREEMARLR